MRDKCNYNAFRLPEKPIENRALSVQSISIKTYLDRSVSPAILSSYNRRNSYSEGTSHGRHTGKVFQSGRPRVA